VEVLRGYIREINADYPESPGAAVVTVECQDDSIRLDREHHTLTWATEDEPISDTDILSELLGRYGLVNDGSAAGESSIVDLSQDSTDIKLLQARAEANAYELRFTPRGVYFGPMRLEAEPQPTILVYAGPDTNCLSLSIRGDAHQADAVAFDIPDEEGEGSTEYVVEPDLPVMGPVHAVSDGAGLEPFVWRMSGEAGASLDQLTLKARRKANELDIQKVKAEGELDGSIYGHVLVPGSPVVVDGVGDRLSGTYYVDHVTHVFDVNGYRQRFQLLRNAYGDNVDGTAGSDVLSAVW
jgi:hypothetical protein